MNKLIAALLGSTQINIAADFQKQGKIEAGQNVSLRGEKGKTLTCTSGEIWITREGDFKDYILLANQSMLLAGKGKTVLGGLASSDYQLA